MTPEERLRDDLERVKFCPHMDWQTNRCPNCRAYRLASALERAWAERDDQIRQAEIQAHRALDAEAALARVRALCDDEPNWNGPEVNSEVRWFANDIRAAIDEEGEL